MKTPQIYCLRCIYFRWVNPMRLNKILYCRTYSGNHLVETNQHKKLSFHKSCLPCSVCTWRRIRHCLNINLDNATSTMREKTNQRVLPGGVYMWSGASTSQRQSSQITLCSQTRTLPSHSAQRMKSYDTDTEHVNSSVLKYLVPLFWED